MERNEQRAIWTKLTVREANAEAAAVMPAAPLDIGCGVLVPLRWSNLCVVYNYDHTDACSPDVVEDKPFEMHVIVQTTRGRWDFHGKNGVEDVDASLLVAGVHGDRYGCRHDRRFTDGNIIASLRADALEEDGEPIFSRQTLPIDVSRMLRKAIAAENIDDFDSRVFEIFDYVSVASLRATNERRASRLRMRRVKRFIEDHAFESIGLREIASSVGLSPFVCLRQFKATTGVTPHAYVSDLRLRQAQRLLKSTQLPIAVVASSVGVADQCYFARWFSKKTGVAPSVFRRTAT